MAPKELTAKQQRLRKKHMMYYQRVIRLRNLITNAVAVLEEEARVEAIINYRYRKSMGWPIFTVDNNKHIGWIRRQLEELTDDSDG